MKYLLFFCFISTYAQQNNIPSIEDALKKYDFIQGTVVEERDTIIYYLKNYVAKPKNLVVYIQGTNPDPIFSYSYKDDKTTIYRWFGDDFKQLDDSYTYAIIPKPAMAGIFNENDLSVPDEYYEKNYLDYRVNQIDLTIQDIVDKHLNNIDKIIVYGHSEGATIAAPLALKNKSITHLGFWSGNVLNNFYEFSLFNRIETLVGTQSDSLAHENIMGIIEWYKSVIHNPHSTTIDHFGFTNKRWASYEKAPIEYLLEVDIPIYACFATEDESTPIETAYLLPIQFMQKRKSNLTFEVCMGCDHIYQEIKDGQVIKNWESIFKDFLNWTIETK